MQSHKDLKGVWIPHCGKTNTIALFLFCTNLIVFDSTYVVLFFPKPYVKLLTEDSHIYNPEANQVFFQCSAVQCSAVSEKVVKIVKNLNRQIQIS